MYHPRHHMKIDVSGSSRSGEAVHTGLAQTGLSGERIVKAVLQGRRRIINQSRAAGDTRLANQGGETISNANNERRIHENYNRNITRHFLISHHPNFIL